MRLPPEQAYRNHLSIAPDCLTEALDSVVPPDSGADDAATRLTRRLCFEPAKFGDEENYAFSEALPAMQDHGVRQVALVQAVMGDENIRDRAPTWLEPRLFGQAVLTADVGLVFVPHGEVDVVNRYGPKYGEYYSLHPEYGYAMAQEALDGSDPGSQFIAAFIARHHMVQARNRYGLEWSRIEHGLISPQQADIAVALEKPFDYFDDFFGRRGASQDTFSEQAAVPYERFTRSMGQLLCNNLALAAAIETRDFDPALPGILAGKIVELVTDTGATGIGEVYRRLRPDLAAPTLANA